MTSQFTQKGFDFITNNYWEGKLVFGGRFRNAKSSENGYITVLSEGFKEFYYGYFDFAIKIGDCLEELNTHLKICCSKCNRKVCVCDMVVHPTSQCDVCLEQKDMTIFQKLECQHSFCIDCLDKLCGEKQFCQKCPMCRACIRPYCELSQENRCNHEDEK